MARGRRSKSAYDKLKALDPDFVEVTLGLQGPDLKNKIIDLAKYQKEILEAKAQDMDLKRIIEQKSVAEEVYKTNLSAIKLKVNYLLDLLKEKGA